MAELKAEVEHRLEEGKALDAQFAETLPLNVNVFNKQYIASTDPEQLENKKVSDCYSLTAASWSAS